MKTILEKTQKIIEEFELKPNSYSEDKLSEFLYSTKRKKINEKWKNHIVDGYYGFESESLCSLWIEVIDIFLEEIRELDQEFRIYQIKTKFGGARIYIESDKIENLQESVNLMEKVLFDERFIY